MVSYLASAIPSVTVFLFSSISLIKPTRTHPAPDLLISSADLLGSLSYNYIELVVKVLEFNLMSSQYFHRRENVVSIETKSLELEFCSL